MELPLIGIGTYTVKPQEEINNMLGCAIRGGYTMIDTAEIYRNQKYIGTFLKNNPDIKRENIWITSKINFANVLKEDMKEINKSLNKTFIDLNTNYIDLYLIHCPVETMNVKIWNILRDYQKEGKIKHVGLSNFTLDKLKDFINKIGDEESKYIYCNQIEYNPFLNRKDLVNFCLEHNIKVVAYGSLNKKNKLIEDIANSLNKTPEQVLLKWALQNKVHIIPMAQDVNYIKDNISLDFNIDINNMELMNDLNENYAVFAKYL
jgi:diketogulonate reductase-like aldo/keto reductase